jgi:Transposase DDE domain
MSTRKHTKRKRANRRGTARQRDRQRPRAGKPRRGSHAEALDRLREWLLPHGSIFAGLPLHGNTTWRPAALVWLALCWSWSDARNVTDAFAAAAAQCGRLGVTGLTTYQGLMNALVAWTDSLLALLWPILWQRMEEIGGASWRTGHWLAIAFDGSRSTAPRTESNEKAFCAANYGRGKTAKYRKKQTKGMRRRQHEKNPPQPQEPQAWITLLWHMGLRLPWTWRLGPSNSSERAHVMEMIEQGEYPKNTLFCGDAGFIGYLLWALIGNQGFHFLVRVGANVHLLSETLEWRREGDGSVLCWPKNAQRLRQPPLRLRLVQVKIGKTKMWMLTNVLESARLTKTQIVRLYRMRWGIEVEFRGLKQTLDRAKLRCRNADRLLVELHWSILAMAVAELFALKEQLAPRPGKAKAKSPPTAPERRSLAQTMRALRWCLNHLTETPEPGRDLETLLRQAITDGYIRRKSKKARYRPPNPDKKPLGDPQVRPLTTEQKKKLKASVNNKNTA